MVLWFIALFIIFSGHEIGFFLLISTIGLIALWEFYGMLDHAKLPNFKLTALICAVVFLSGSFYFLSQGHPAQSHTFEVGVLVLFLLVTFARQMFVRTRDISPLNRMAYTIFGLLYVIWLFNFMTKIVYAVPDKGHFYVLYLLVITKFSDMGAYLVGSVIGKHLLIPHISPKKTWEGFFGALFFSVLGSFLLLWLMPGNLPGLNATHATILGLTLGFAAVIGDLAESILKRSTDVKDSGTMLPGIGGALDLIDSLLFTAPLLYFYLRLVMQFP